MYWVFMLMFIVFLIMQLVSLFMALKKKDSKDWSRFFGITAGSILGCIVIFVYEGFFPTLSDDAGIIVLLFSVVSFLSYIFVLGLGFVLKLFQKNKTKKKDANKEKKNKGGNLKKTGVLAVTFLAVSLCMCVVDTGVYAYLDKVECERYDAAKEEKLVDMVEYINKKYDFGYTVDDNVFFREYKYSKYEINEKKHNDFYVGIFDNGKDIVTISLNKDGFISDNTQIGEIGYLLGDYYSDIVSNDIEYVEVRHKGASCEDDLINEVLQFNFNEIITKDNIGLFVDELLKNDVEMIFYMKDRSKIDSILKETIDKLSYLEDNENVKSLAIYVYDSNNKLIVEDEIISVRGDYKYDDVHLSYYSSHMFGFVYVSNNIEFDEGFNKNNKFVSIAFSNQKYSKADKYKNKDIRVINDWNVFDFE